MGLETRQSLKKMVRFVFYTMLLSFCSEIRFIEFQSFLSTITVRGKFTEL